MEYSPTYDGKDAALIVEFQRLAEILNSSIPQLPILYAEPARLRDGMVVIADGTEWDPVSTGVRTPVWYDEEAAIWKAL